jgi:SAM-dependent methyltransferase
MDALCGRAERLCYRARVLRTTLARIGGRLRLALASDRAFVEQAYRDVLQREADQDGLRFYTGLLREGKSRMAVLLSLARSDEFAARLAPRAPAADIRRLRPERYHAETDTRTGASLLVFDDGTPAGFDWLESMILEHGYYERPGVWGLEVDTDKRVMAEMVAALGPRTALELGCASGAVLRCLADLGVHAEGIEISAMALAHASPDVKPRIHHGDLLRLALGDTYDVVFGLDVFEHLNPNRLDEYLSRVAALTAGGGYVFANVPAFGADPVFGTVFPFYVGGWEEDAAAGRLFTKLHVDEEGFPLHGHLVCADWALWVSRFERHGLRRATEVEAALHRRYDTYFDQRSPARRSFFVFAKQGDAGRDRALAARIAAEPSRVLADA